MLDYFVQNKVLKKFLLFFFMGGSSLFPKENFTTKDLHNFSKNITSYLKIFDFEKEINKEKLSNSFCSYKPKKSLQLHSQNLKDQKIVWTRAKIVNFAGEGILEIRSRKISQICAFHYSELKKDFIILPLYSYDWLQKLAFRYYHIYIPKLSEPLQLYLFVNQDIPHEYEIWLYDKEKFLDEQRIRNFFFGIYYGCIIVFLVFSFLLFLVTKDLSQLYYGFLVIGLVSTDAYFSGSLKLILEDLFNTNIFFERTILLITQIFALLLLNETVRNFLRKTRFISLLPSLIILAVISVPVMIFIPEKNFLSFFYLLSIVVIVFILIMFIQAIFTKEVISIIIILSFLVLVVTSLINILAILNLFPLYLFIEDNLKVGILALIFVHSFLLSYKTHINQKQLLESSYILEQKIRERTLQLTKTVEELKEKDSNFQSQLNLASELQRSLFPTQHQKYPLLEFQIFQRGILQVVGDFFDVLPHKDGSVSFFIADASGHGVSAALLTTLCKIIIREAVLKNPEPSLALAEINQRLTNVLKTHNFITLFLFTLSADGKLKYSNAGHNPVFLFRSKTKTLEILSAKGGFLGIQRKNLYFEQKQTQIQRKDRILLFTDGFAYVLNLRKNKQQMETLKTIFLYNQQDDLQKSFESIVQDWSSRNSENKEDDVTFVILEYTGVL